MVNFLFSQLSLRFIYFSKCFYFISWLLRILHSFGNATMYLDSPDSMASVETRNIIDSSPRSSLLKSLGAIVRVVNLVM